MRDWDDPGRLPLPRGWPRHAKAAILNALSLASATFTLHLGRWMNVLSPVARLQAEVERRDAEIAMLREELRIKDTRMATIPPKRRPRYRPTDRMAILELRALSGWSLAETARRLLLDQETLSRWMRRLGESGEAALVRLAEPVNRFPDFIRHLVQRLKALCPTLGKVKIAETLARAGLHIAPTTVGRMLNHQKPDSPGAAGEAEPAPELTVTSKRPNHVHHVDLTIVPTVLGGFWSAISPFSLPQRWPFCHWMAVVEDHFSRRLLGIDLFASEPSSKQITDFLDRVFGSHGTKPNHIISDRGRQFDCKEYRAWCGYRGVRWRYGAAGKKGSIAVIERLIRTIKDEWTRRILVSLSADRFREDLTVFARWYNGHRTNSGLRGRTPHEVYFGREPASEAPRFEPRGKYPRDAWCASPQARVKGRRGVRLEVTVRNLEGRKQLPIVELRPAA